GHGANRTHPQHHRPKARPPCALRFWNRLRLQRPLMPRPIVTETPARGVFLPLLLGCRFAAASQHGAKLLVRRLVTRRLLTCLPTCPLITRRLVTSPWRRVVQFGLPILVGRVHRRLVLQRR